jgi:ribonucleotide reductase alpha subunit
MAIPIVAAIQAAELLTKLVFNYQQIGEQQRTKRREIAAFEKIQSLNIAASACTNYKHIAEQEQTKRREIDAWEKETITKINAQRGLLMAYLDKSFDERAENFRSLFAVVDSAIASDNNEQLALALNSITEIAKSSPFKDLANLNSVRAALNDPNYEWTF